MFQVQEQLEDVPPVFKNHKTSPLLYKHQILNLKKEELDISDDTSAVVNINYAASGDSLNGVNEHELLVDGITANANVIEVEQEVTPGVIAKAWRCGLCSYQCTLKGNMKKHLIVHSGTKPHRCTFCVKSFADSSNLKRHLKFVHSSNKQLA